MGKGWRLASTLREYGKVGCLYKENMNSELIAEGARGEAKNGRIPLDRRNLTAPFVPLSYFLPKTTLGLDNH
jgi:hypothetical protein